MPPEADEAWDATNTDEIISGEVRATLNSSLTWEFEIPSQKHKYGVISCKKAANGTEIMPVPLMDFVFPPRFTNRVYDGK